MKPASITSPARYRFLRRFQSIQFRMKIAQNFDGFWNSLNSDEQIYIDALVDEFDKQFDLVKKSGSLEARRFVVQMLIIREAAKLEIAS